MERDRLVQMIEYIKRLKKERNITSAELAELADIPKSTLDKLLTYQINNPNFSNICNIVQVLNGSLDEMLNMQTDDEEEKTAGPKLINAIHDSEREGWAQLNNARLEHINRQSRHIKRQTGIIIGLICALFVLSTLTVILVIDANSPTWGIYQLRP